MGIQDASVVGSDLYSSAGDLIDEIQDRIPEEKIENIFPVLNRVIRIISKRLFTLKSDLIIGSLNLPIYAEQIYTASTIAFVGGTPGTITDSASQFVIELFKAGMYIETDSAANTGPYRLDTVVAGTLTLNRLHSLTAVGSGSSVTLTSIAQYGPLPNDFWGLCDRPNISGRSYPLMASPGRSTEIQFPSAGDPRYYRVKGSDLWVFPAAATDVVLEGDYWKKPTVISGMEDAIPFAQLLDDAIQESLVMTLGGGAAVSSEQLKTFLDEQVDLVVNQRALKAPTEMPEGLDYSQY